MDATKALRFVAAAFNLTNYRIAKESGVAEALVGRIINGTNKTYSLESLSKIARGLGRIDWRAKVIFLALLTADVPEDDVEPEIRPSTQYYADWIEKIYRLFARHNLIDPARDAQLRMVLTTLPTGQPQQLWEFLAEDLINEEMQEKARKQYEEQE